MTLSHQQLFEINYCFETQPQTHILCSRWESGRSLNLTDEFSLLKSENKSILFLLTTVFSQLLIDNFGDTQQISCWRQKIMDEKKLSTTFCLFCQQPYTKSQLPREIFIPVGFFEQLVEWGQETFDSWKRGGINFSSSRSCYHCTTDMLAELYCQQDQSLFQKFS